MGEPILVDRNPDKVLSQSQFIELVAEMGEVLTSEKDIPGIKVMLFMRRCFGLPLGMAVHYNKFITMEWARKINYEFDAYVYRVDTSVKTDNKKADDLIAQVFANHLGGQNDE